MTISAGLGALGSIANMAGKIFGPKPEPRAVMQAPAPAFEQLLKKVQSPEFASMDAAAQKALLEDLLKKSVTLRTKGGEAITGMLEEVDHKGAPPTATVAGRKIALADIQSVG